MKVDRRFVEILGIARGGHAVIQRDFVASDARIFPGQYPLEQVVEGFHKSIVAAEGITQQSFVPARIFDAGPLVMEDTHIRAPEGIDALLGVADHEQASVLWPAQHFDDIAL